MQYPNLSAKQKRLWHQQLVENIFKTPVFFLHGGFFVGAALIGIARYIYTVPVELTVLMAVWSVALLLHGLFTWQKGSSSEAHSKKVKDGVAITVLSASALNAIMWVMWTLATDAREGSPWHLTVLISLLAITVSGLIIGKRMLYAHWLKEFMQDNPELFAEMKPKRYENSLKSLGLNDGELVDYPDEVSNNRLENSNGWKPNS